MGRRYYCDYCDKSFIDDVEARKKHLNSVHHVKLKKLHYDTCRDIRTLVREESEKVPCRRFLTNGYCQFDSGCKYTHYSQEELWQMKQQILYEEQQKVEKLNERRQLPSLDSWLEKLDGEASPFWKYPEHLERRSDLPPSLRRFRPEHFAASTSFDEWGY